MNRYHLRIPAVLLCCLASSAYASLGGQINNGRYYSADKQLSVSVPDLTEVSIADTEDPSFTAVRFISGKYYWMMDGDYFLVLIKNRKITPKIFSLLPIPMKIIIKNDYKSVLKMQGCKYIHIHATKAYQCIGHFVSSETPGIFVGTSLVVNGQLVNAYAIEATGDKQKLQFHWGRYNKMINSIQIRR